MWQLTKNMGATYREQGQTQSANYICIQKKRLTDLQKESLTSITARKVTYTLTNFWGFWPQKIESSLAHQTMPERHRPSIYH